MLDKVVAVLVYIIAITFVGLATLPYLLYRAWEKRIAFKKQGRRPDFDSSASKPAGKL